MSAQNTVDGIPGIGGRHALEWVVDIIRNEWTAWSGIRNYLFQFEEEEVTINLDNVCIVKFLPFTHHASFKCPNTLP